MIVMAVPKIQEDMLLRILPGRCAVRTAWPVKLDGVSAPGLHAVNKHLAHRPL